MHVNPFDHYQAQTSFIHRLDPRVKVLVTLGFILSTVLLPNAAWPGFALAWVLLLAGHQLARVSLIFTLKRSLLALPFTLAAVTVAFTLPGQPLASGQLGPWRFVITDAGVARFASIVLRSWLSLQAAVLLTATTRFPDLLHALRHLRFPKTLVAIIAFMYRYLFVLADEALRLLRARDARSARLADATRGSPLLWRARVAGDMAGQLFLRSIERSERIYHAMQARGFHGEFLTFNPHHMAPPDWVFAFSALALLVGLQIVARLPMP